MPQSDLFPELPDYDPGPADGVRVGESPMSGLILRRILEGHTGLIRRMAWSSNGKFLASPSEDGTVRVWNVVLGKCVAVLKKKDYSISEEIEYNCVAWAPDDRFIASGSNSGRVYIWNTDTWQIFDEIQEQTGNIYCLAWSPDGSMLASGSGWATSRLESGNIYIWNPKTRESIKFIEVDDSDDDVEVSFLSWSPDGLKLVSGSTDNIVRVFQVDSNFEVLRLIV